MKAYLVWHVDYEFYDVIAVTISLTHAEKIMADEKIRTKLDIQDTRGYYIEEKELL